MAILPTPTTDKKANDAVQTAVSCFAEALAREQDYSDLIIDTLCATASTCRLALLTAHTTLTTEKGRLEEHVFTDPLILGTLSLAYPTPSSSSCTSSSSSNFPQRVYANMNACLNLYIAGQTSLRVFEEDLRREWQGVRSLNAGKRRDFVGLARNKLVAVVGVNEGLRDEVVKGTRKLEHELRDLEGRLRRGEEFDGEGEGIFVERDG